MKQPVIYKIRNVVNNKFYVGSTTDTRERFRNHRKMLRGRRHHCPHLQAAWNKYGEDCFIFEIVETLEDVEVLQGAESRWLAEHFGKDHCYNAGSAPEAPMRGRFGSLHPNYGKSLTENQKATISTTLKAFYAEDPNNHPRLGKTHSDETKTKISVKVNQAIAEGRGSAFIPSEETRKKMSEALKGNQNALGYKRTEAECEAIRQRVRGNTNFLGKTHTEEAKEKMRRPVYAILPDGSRRDFAGTALAGEALKVPYQMLVRSMKARKPIAKGKLTGWLFCYTDDPVDPPTPVEIPEEFKHLPRTRQEAKDKGEKYYFTGLPCTYGHISPRLTKGTCMTCLKPPSKNAVAKEPLTYANNDPRVASLVRIYSSSKEQDQSEWPSKLTYLKTEEGVYQIETDVYRIPEDLETAVVELLGGRGQAPDVYWREAKRWFPAKAYRALESLSEAVKA